MADAEDLKSSGDFSSCGFDSHPGHQFLLSVQAITLCPAEVFAPFGFDASLIVPRFVPMDFRFSWTFGIYNTLVVATTG
jgi:hypothetical protein